MWYSIRGGIILICLVLLGSKDVLSQGRKNFVWINDTIQIPAVKGEKICLKIHPSISGKTPWNRMPRAIWVLLSPPDSQKEVHEPPRVFKYVVTPVPEKYYLFLCSDSGMPVSREEYDTTTFSSVSSALASITDKQYEWNKTERYSKMTWEVSRWQYPNLHALFYDNERKGHYKFRVGLVICFDELDPRAYCLD